MADSLEVNRDAYWLERLPKVELHLHLEGAMSVETLWALVRKYGGNESPRSISALRQRLEYRDFGHFIDTWVWKNGFIREYEDFTLIAESVARDLARQNVRYAEVFFSPGDFARRGLTTHGLAEAIRTGLARVPEVEVALVPDLVRDFGPGRAAATLAEVAEVAHHGIVGIGLGGSEPEFPPEPFAAVFEKARRLGLHTTVHAGEAAGAESIWGAIRALQPDRIGHGTRAYEDEALIRYLAEHRTPLEMCPVSNVRTGVVASVRDHPIRRYFEAGLCVTVNSDDPLMFGNSLTGEYVLVMAELGFSREDMVLLALNAVDASWLADDKKRPLRRAITEAAGRGLRG